MTYPYTQSEYDAFGWSTLSRAELPPAETHGLDYESAREATPRRDGVSFGNGSDGVSHIWPDYYCRTADPFTLAAAAMIGSCSPGDGYRFAAENCEIDGEADYTISATILDPPNDYFPLDDDDDAAQSWSEDNGAWMIWEVFPVGDMPGALSPNGEFVQYNPFDRSAYTSLESCFTDDVLQLAATV